MRRCGVLFRTFSLRVCDLRDGDPVDDCIELSNLGIMKEGPDCSDLVEGSDGFNVLGVPSLSTDLWLLALRSLSRESDNGSSLVLGYSAPTSNSCAVSLSEGSSSISLWSAVDAPSVETLASSQLSPRLALGFCRGILSRLAILQG